MHDQDECSFCGFNLLFKVTLLVNTIAQEQKRCHLAIFNTTQYVLYSALALFCA